MNRFNINTDTNWPIKSTFPVAPYHSTVSIIQHSYGSPRNESEISNFDFEFWGRGKKQPI